MNFLENIILQQVVQKLGWSLIHFLWEGTAAALLLAILLRLLRKSTANLHYVVTCLTLGLMAFLPIVTFPLVSATVPDPAAIDQQKTTAMSESAVTIPMAEVPAVELPTSDEGLGIRQSILWKDRVIGALGVSLPYIVFGWLVGVFGLSIWHLGGWAQLQRFRRKMIKQVSERVRLRTRHLAEKMGVKRIVTIMESALVQVPTVVGWLKPVILLPASALSGLSGEQIEAILAHELAHIKRLDYLVNMLQTIVEILGFYHPAVWWVSRKIRAERENCCDDMAVSISGDRVCYARALTTMEQIRAGGPGLAVAASGGSLFERIRRLIGRDSAKDGRLSWLPSVVAILLVTASVILVSCSMSGRTVEKFEVQVEREKVELAPTSYIDADGRIVDKTDYPFVDDPEVIGGWKSVDFVRDVDEFDPTKRSWEGDLYLNNLIFGEGGNIAGNALTWTKGLVLGDDTASKYIIREIDGSTYMFFEWKSGDYTIRHMKPSYYVLMKVLAESLKYEPMFGQKAYIPPTSTINEKGYIVDKIDYPFVNDPEVIGTWKAIDCVDEIEQFRVNEKQWISREGELFLHEMIFEKDGRLSSKNDNEPKGYPETWTKGLIIYENNDTKQASKYTIKEIGDSIYMFYEWKSGDYTIRHMKPSYYVLRKASFDTASWKKDVRAERAKEKKSTEESENEIRREKIIEARNNPQIIHGVAYSLFEKIKDADYDYFLSVDWGQFPIVEYYNCYKDYPVLVRWICKTFKENPIVSIELGDASFSEGWPRIYYKLILKDGAILEGDLHFEYHFYHSDDGRWCGIHGHSYDGPETPYKTHGIDWHLQDEPIKRPEAQSADSSDAPQILTSGYILSVPPEMPQLKEIILNDRSKAQMITPEKLEEFLDVVRTTPGARVIAAPKLLTNNGEDGEIRTENAVGFDSIKIDIKNTVGVDRKTVHLELDFEYSVSMGQDLKSTKAETTAAVLSEHAIAIAGGVPVDGQKVILLVKPQVLERRFSKTGIAASCKLKSEEEVSKEDKIEVQARFLLVPTDANALKDFCENEGIVFPKGQEDSDFASVLNGEQAEKLLKLAQAEPDSKLLAAPNVKVLDGEQATMSLQRTIMYSNPDSNQAEPKKLPVGTIIEVKPILEDSGEKIMLEIEFEQRNFLGFENEVPQVKTASGQGHVKILNGQTVLLGGQKITDEVDDRKVEKTFLCLVKAEKAEVENNDKD